MQLRRAIIFLLFSSYVWATSFDKPLATKTVDLGPSKYSSETRAQVKCYYFPGFMVKEVDQGEKGAAKLAIVPNSHVVPKCTQARYKSEMVVNAEEWSGYFKGVKDGFVFFDADDGVNGGMGFAVYDAHTGKKLFSDSAVGPLQFPERTDNTLVVKYERLVQAECVIQNEFSDCWRQIKKDLALENTHAPDCRAGYEKSAFELAKGRCQTQTSTSPQCMEKEIALARKQTDDSPSVIVYPVEVILGGQRPHIRPVGGEVRCWAAD